MAQPSNFDPSNPMSNEEISLEKLERTPDQERTVPDGNHPANDKQLQEETQSLGDENSDKEHLQRGVQQAQAITASWSKKSLLLAYAGFVNSVSIAMQTPFLRCHAVV
jgi:hypothetical protein